jgi:hypothetical protein
MRRVVAAAVTASMLSMLSGCAAMRDNHSTCVAVWSGTGALLGATAGGLISGVAAEHGDSGGSKNWEIGLATGGGAVGGGLIGWGLSNYFCEEPPPPPPPARVPPPPPPPPTERRGG